MNIELYNKDKHYTQLCEAWKKHNHRILEADIIPRTSFIVSENDKFISFISVYFMDGCNLAQIAWATSNPEFSLKKRYLAMNMVIESALYSIRKNERKNVVCFVEPKSGLSKLLEKRNLVPNKINHELMTGVM